MSYADTDAVEVVAETAEQAVHPGEAITLLETEAIRLRADLAESQRSVRILLERRELDAEVWIPPREDCMDSAHDPACPFCGSRTFHVRTSRCGECGRHPAPVALEMRARILELERVIDAAAALCAALVALAREAGAPFEIVDEFLRVPVDECVRRDAERPRPVGETVIRGMHERHLVTRCAP